MSLSSSGQEDRGEVVAIGTGDACLSSQSVHDDKMESTILAAAEKLKLDDGAQPKSQPVPQKGDAVVPVNGMVLFDCHAEVIARRALIKLVAL